MIVKAHRRVKNRHGSVKIRNKKFLKTLKIVEQRKQGTQKLYDALLLKETVNTILICNTSHNPLQECRNGYIRTTQNDSQYHTVPNVPANGMLLLAHRDVPNRHSRNNQPIFTGLFLRITVKILIYTLLPFCLGDLLGEF